jgi:cobalt-zinc-cadmium efflux system membrane fusion protein
MFTRLTFPLVLECRSHRRARARHVAVVVGLVLTVCLSVGCTPKEHPNQSSHVRRPDRSVVLAGPSAAWVRAEPAKAASGERSRGLVAQIGFDERHLARLGPPVQGRVAMIKVVAGDQVKAGDVLLTIHAPDIASAQAQVAQAKTARLLAERVAERAEMLAKQGAGSDAERQQAEAALAQSKSEEGRAIAALAALGGASGTADYALRSPIDGAVVERNVSVGTEVHADQDAPLLTIADVSNVWVIAEIFEQELPRVKMGDEALVSVQSYPDKTFKGTITHVSETIDPATRAAKARIELPNPELLLKPGMFAHVMVKGVAVGAAEVPSAAVLARRDEFFVFVKQDDGSWIERKVQVGEQHGAHTTILAGLKPGELVATEGAILLDAEVNEAL